MFGKGKRSKGASAQQPDSLRPDNLVSPEEALYAAAGIPATADSIAYEPTQRLLAVATSDGKVKLFGKAGVELTLYSNAKYPYATRQLQFLSHRGVLVRVAKGGFMESWSICGTRMEGGVRMLNTVKLKRDKITCVADMLNDPYILLGCTSGCLRIAMSVDSLDEPTSAAKQIRGFAVAPYRVKPEQLDGIGEVSKVVIQSFGPVHRGLVLFSEGTVSVWNFRAASLITSIKPREPEAGPTLAAAGDATAVCWVNTGSADFATGHESGRVLVWSLDATQALQQAAIVACLRVVDGDAEPVRMVRCVYASAGGAEGDDAGGGAADRLLVLGGQEREQPEGLTLLPLPAAPPAAQARRRRPRGTRSAARADGGDEEYQGSSGGGAMDEPGSDEEGSGGGERRAAAAAAAAEPVKLPWFGNLIGFFLASEEPMATGYEEPTAVVQLLEGGQLVVYHIRGGKPQMAPQPFQADTQVTVAELSLLPISRPSSHSPGTMYLAALRRLAAAGADDPLAHDPSGMHAWDAGMAAVPPPDARWGLVYATGYRDGSVRLWDVATGAPQLLARAGPEPGGSSGGEDWPAPRAVSAVLVAWQAGLVAVGHQKGELRVYQFSTVERHLECVTLESMNSTGAPQPLTQPAGLQLRARVLVNCSDISCLAYCPALRLLAACDKGGGVALVDTGVQPSPVVRWYCLTGSNALLAASIAPAPLPAGRHRMPQVAGEEGSMAHVLFYGDSEGCLGGLDIAHGCFVGKSGPLVPKNHSYTLALELLNAEGEPLVCEQHAADGCSQATLGGGGGGGSSGRKQASRARSRSDDDTDSEAAGSSDSEADGDEDEDADGGEGVEDMDVDALLARAAQQVDASSSGRDARAGQVRGAGSGRSRATHDRDRASSGRNRRSTDGAGGVSAASGPDPPAQYVLVVTDQYLRVYGVGHVLTADRTSHAKRSPSAQLVYARVFHVSGAPAVLALAAAEHGLSMQVYSLPSLELVSEAPLSAYLGWFWDVPPGHQRKLGQLLATSRLGHMAVLGLANELMWLGIAQGLPPLPLPQALFNQQLAAEALKQRLAFEKARVRGLRLHQLAPPAPVATASRAHSLMSDGGAHDDSPVGLTEGRRVDKPLLGQLRAPAERVAGAAEKVATDAAERVTGAAEKVAEGAGSVASKGSVLLGGMLSKVQQGVQKLAVQAQKGVAQVSAMLIDDGANVLPGGSSNRGGAATPSAAAAAADPSALPELGAIFSQTVPEDDPEVMRMRKRLAKRSSSGKDAARTGAGGGSQRQQQQQQGAYDEVDDIELDSISDSSSDDGGMAPTRTAAPAKPTYYINPANIGPSSGRASAGASSAATQRAELLGGARAGASAGKPHARTADEIKRAYGRDPATSATARANNVHAVMAENRSKLEERGEKLRSLDQKAGDLEGAAQGFADMARQLAEQQRNKKWWQ